MLVLDDATLWLGDGQKMHGHVVVDGDRIRTVGQGRYTGDTAKVSLKGMALSPGMIDLMVLGGFGQTLDKGDAAVMAQKYLALGVTACQFCTGMLPWEVMQVIASKMRTAMKSDERDRARILGLYWEGPFQLPHCSGASLAEFALPATREVVDHLLAAFGDITTMVNVSPGVPEAARGVGQFVEAGKIVSMAHSDVHADEVLACVDAGTSVLGHCWNNHSGGLLEPGVQRPMMEHVALTDDRITAVHVICDGVHVHPLVVKLIDRAKGYEGLCLVTDAVSRAGVEDGTYIQGDGRVFTKQGSVGRTDKGGLCGSGLLLPDHLRNYMRFTGRPAHQAIRTVTHNPARSLGLQDQLGLIATGHTADLVAWSPDMQVQRVWRAGREIDAVSDYAEVKLTSRSAF